MRPIDKPTREHALQRQIDRVTSRLDTLHATSQRIMRVRLTVFVVGVGLAVASFFASGIIAFWLLLLVTAVVFSIVVYFHRQVTTSIERHTAWNRIKKTHLARMQLDWDVLPPQQDVGALHPLEIDLDLTGHFSIHRLLDTTVTVDGGNRLRQWLNAPQPDPDIIAQRQTLVEELRPRPLLRDKLTLQARLASRTEEKWSADTLEKWLNQNAPEGSLRTWVILLALLSIANITLFALSLTGQIGSLWLITFIPYVALTLMRTTRVQPVFAEASSLRDALQQLLAVFEVLENYSYRDTPRLAELCAPFRDPDHRPSRYLKRIGRIVNAMGIRGNGLVALLLNAVVPWDYYFAYQLEQQKVAIRNMLPEWMTAWVEVEAISALATFAYLNPNYTPPQISDAGPWLNAKQLGHPLLPDADKVANDFAVTQLGEIELITGSNMAGKSTFLRTVGVNLVLAYAGSVVDADRLAIRPMRLFTCIRVADSVTDGISYFYAEVQRLRDLLLSLREENELPLFFFVDEIFRGTNNRERLIGSRAYVRALADADGVGMISTHDLELVTLADEIALMHNYHFRETIADGRMVFDYKLQHGPCPTTNALEIMRLEGLPVPTSQSSEV